MSLLLRRLWIQATADRRRLGVLCALLLVGVVLWGRNVLDAQNESLGGMLPPAGGASPGGAGHADNEVLPVLQVSLDRVPNRDPLGIDSAAFPKPTQVTVLPKEDPKSGGNEAENEQRRRAALLALADRFVLEAVMIGRPLAVINGRTYRTREYVPQNEIEMKLGYEVPVVGKPEIKFELVRIVNREDQGDREFRTYVVLEYEGTEYRVPLRD